MYALDTNTVIYFFKGQGRVAERLFEHSPKQVAIPIIVVYELEVGIAKSDSPTRRRRQLAELLASMALLPLGVDEAKAAARVRAGLERAGTPIGPLDTLIAGTALRHGATLVTHNLKEFGRVEGLAVRDWFE